MAVRRGDPAELLIADCGFANQQSLINNPQSTNLQSTIQSAISNQKSAIHSGVS
jgi:hypothetical protein